MERGWDLKHYTHTTGMAGNCHCSHLLPAFSSSSFLIRTPKLQFFKLSFELAQRGETNIFIHFASEREIHSKIFAHEKPLLILPVPLPM